MVPPDPRGTPSPMSYPRAAIQELTKGRELAARLGALLRRSSGGGAEDETGELAEGVMMCITRALATLDSGESSEVWRVPAAWESSLSSDDGKSHEGSTGKRKIRPAAVPRGGHRRRSHSDACTVTANTLDDGHTWRKYGQKDIHSAKFPRSYFRCTHKHDQGCQATRQVQKSEEDPSAFLITYVGHHTCMSPTKYGRRAAGDSFPISIAAPEDPLDVSPAGGRDQPATQPAAAVPPSPKRECADDDERSTLTRNDSSSSEDLMLPELAALGSSMAVLAAAPVVSGAAASDAGDATSILQYSCMCPGTIGHDMDPSVDSFSWFEGLPNWDDVGDDFKFLKFDGVF